MFASEGIEVEHIGEVLYGVSRRKKDKAWDLQ